MKYLVEVMTALFLTCTIAIAVGTSAGDATTNQSQKHVQGDTQDRRTQQMATPEISRAKQAAEQNAQKALDQDAIGAIASTRKAIDAIKSNRNDQAIKSIEDATGKINILVARNPANALIPVSTDVRIIDVAPEDLGTIKGIANDASWAVEAKDFPAARVLLDQLVSEIRVRTYNLPLATYPVALQEAARLLDQKKASDAAIVLQTALNTLVAVDNVTPIPIVVAREAVKQAQAQEKNDKNTAQNLLQVAKNELDRARELGYAGKDQEYASLNNEISDLQKQLASNGDTNSIYAKLKERIDAFLNRQSKQQNGTTQPQRTAQAR